MNEFKIHFSEEQLESLRHRLEYTRLPERFQSENWKFGVDDDYLLTLLEYWRDGYDWTRKEQELNQYAQFTCELDGANIHYFHIRGRRKNSIPLLMTHGWPDSFLRYAKVFPLLAEYDLIVPSLPGFGFSTLPPKGFLNNAEIAEIWHRLMTEILGYKEYAATGGDIGRGVTCFLAARHSNAVKGIHLTDVGLVKELINARADKLSPAELEYKRKANEWLRLEGAYINIQSTKPQTLAYLLSDSPSGMAAWMTEKYHAWSEWSLLTSDDICDSLTLYWLTNTACTSIRAYYGNIFTLPSSKKITVPTAVAAFAHDVLPAPREWIERNYPLIMYTEIPHGGHFTALEQPLSFAENILQFMEKIS